MTAEEKKQAQSSKLMQLAMQYFKKKGYKLEQDVGFDGYSGTSRKFDLIVHKGRVTQPVLVRDWKRTIGVNVIINLDKASSDAGLSNPMIIGEKFSDHAKSYANRRGITLLTKQRLSLSLR
jgi:hypothetical protein